MSHIALRTAPTRAGRFATMKWVNIHALWYRPDMKPRHPGQDFDLLAFDMPDRRP